MNSIGAIIIACFAVVWVGAGAHQLSRRWFIWVLVAAIFVSTAIICAASHVQFGRQTGGFNGKIYGIFVGFEVIAIVCAVILLNQLKAKQYLLPVIAFIVGLHFFGMVPALQSNEFWWVGGVMCALSLLAIFALPQETWTPVVGIGCAVILWLSALGAFF